MNAASLLAAIVESSSDAIIGKALDGTILSWNASAERIFGYSADEMIGTSIRRLIPPERQAEEDVIIASISAGERVPGFETVRMRKDGSPVHVAVTVSPVHDESGNVVAASKIARDITEARAIKQALEDTELRFRLMADNISQLAWIATSEGEVTWYNRRWYDYTGTTPEQMRNEGWRELHHPDHLEAAAGRFFESVQAGEKWEDTFPLRGADGQYRWFLSRAQPLRGQGGKVICWFGTNTDITEQLEAERRIELLMLEVNHRSKNMLAMIQSLARRTAGRSGGNGDFVARLEQRIASLSANQDLLVRRSWANVPMRELVEVQLHFLGDSLAQVTREGPELDITPSAAETIGMALHELATNALKYGALSTADGRVALLWRRDSGILAMEWIESHGPTVREPATRGFGSRLIADVPRGKLGAEVTMDYPPEGFRWDVSFPEGSVLA